jgi:hypothetical protein
MARAFLGNEDNKDEQDGFLVLKFPVLWGDGLLNGFMSDKIDAKGMVEALKKWIHLILSVV